MLNYLTFVGIDDNVLSVKVHYGSIRYANKNLDALLDVTNLQACYFLGFLWADGSVNSHKSINITVTATDREILEALADLVKLPRTSITPKTLSKNRNPQVSINLCSTALIKSLQKFGIIKNKTKTSLPILPEAYESKLAFMRGWIDGDGYVGRQCFISVSTEAQADVCIRILGELGITAKKSKTGKNKMYWNVRINSSQFVNLRPMFALPITALSRKTNAFFHNAK